jgi:hypothetical protein
MTLNRGFGGKRPCPKCMIPAKELSEATKKFPGCTTASMSHVYHDANCQRLATEKEEILKANGIRGVEVHFIIKSAPACQY